MRVLNSVIVLGEDGKPLAGAKVKVKNRPSGTDATVYAGETGASAGENPATTDVHGRVVQWLERGAYTNTISAEGMESYNEAWDAAPAGDEGIDRNWLLAALRKPNVVTKSKAYEAKAGDFVKQTKAGFTITLPTPEENAVVEVYADYTEAGLTTVKAGSGEIIAGVNKAASITLAPGKWVRLVADGTNWLAMTGSDVLLYRASGANTTAVSGDSIGCTAAITVKAPASPAANDRFRVYANTGTSKVEGNGHNIAGDFISATATITLLEGQHVDLVYDGTVWRIVAGEPWSGRSWGNVSATGAIEGGSGDFTVAKVGTGNYEIKWNTARASGKYGVVAMVTQNNPYTATAEPIEAAKCRINIWKNATESVDAPFSFMVIGPG